MRGTAYSGLDVGEFTGETETVSGSKYNVYRKVGKFPKLSGSYSNTAIDSRKITSVKEVSDSSITVGVDAGQKKELNKTLQGRAMVHFLKSLGVPADEPYGLMHKKVGVIHKEGRGIEALVIENEEEEESPKKKRKTNKKKKVVKKKAA